MFKTAVVIAMSCGLVWAQPKIGAETVPNTLAEVLVAEVDDASDFLLRKMAANGSVVSTSPLQTAENVNMLSTQVSAQAAALSTATSASLSSLMSMQTSIQNNLAQVESLLMNVVWAQLNATNQALNQTSAVASQALSIADRLDNVPPPPPTTPAPTYVLPSCPGLTDPANGNVSAHIRGLPGLIATTTCAAGYNLDCSATGADPGSALACGQQQCLTGTGAQAATAQWTPRVQPSCTPCPSSARSFFWRVGHDWRSGNPGQQNSVELVPTTAMRGPSRVTLSWQYVVGYGRCSPCGRSGQSFVPQDGTGGCTTWTCGARIGPTVDIWLVNGANAQQRIQLANYQNLRGYDYDTCAQRVTELRNGGGSANSNRAGWGAHNIANDGCYSPQIPVDYTLTAAQQRTTNSWTSFKIVFAVNNQQRNMHLNDDPSPPGMNITVWSTRC